MLISVHHQRWQSSLKDSKRKKIKKCFLLNPIKAPRRTCVNASGLPSASRPSHSCWLRRRHWLSKQCHLDSQRAGSLAGRGWTSLRRCQSTEIRECGSKCTHNCLPSVQLVITGGRGGVNQTLVRKRGGIIFGQLTSVGIRKHTAFVVPRSAVGSVCYQCGRCYACNLSTYCRPTYAYRGSVVPALYLRGRYTCRLPLVLIDFRVQLLWKLSLHAIQWGFMSVHTS